MESHLPIHLPSLILFASVPLFCLPITHLLCSWSYLRFCFLFLLFRLHYPFVILLSFFIILSNSFCSPVLYSYSLRFFFLLSFVFSLLLFLFRLLYYLFVIIFTPLCRHFLVSLRLLYISFIFSFFPYSLHSPSFSCRVGQNCWLSLLPSFFIIIYVSSALTFLPVFALLSSHLSAKEEWLLSLPPAVSVFTPTFPSPIFPPCLFLSQCKTRMAGILPSSRLSLLTLCAFLSLSHFHHTVSLAYICFVSCAAFIALIFLSHALC